jgi:serine/threonine protein kinase
MSYEETFFQNNCNKIKFPDDEKIYDVSGEDFIFETTRDFLGHGKAPVYSAIHKQTGKEVALKQIPIFHTRYMIKQEQEKIKNALIKELDVMKKVFDSNNIVKIYGFYIADIKAVICMELMSCSLLDLYSRIHKRPDKFGTLSEDLLGEVAVNILDALLYCKKKNIMHRDIKPANILLNGNGEIKLCDFGESRLLENSVATTTSGTLVYFPPERFKQYEYDIRSDVWSLGITMAETAYGKIPYDDIVLTNSGPALYFKIQEIVSAISKEDLVKKCFGRKYSKDARDFLEACLESFEKRPKLDGLQEKEFYIRYKNTDRKPIIGDIVKKMEALCKA